jgi:hypothetical protein
MYLVVYGVQSVTDDALVKGRKKPIAGDAIGFWGIILSNRSVLSNLNFPSVLSNRSVLSNLNFPSVQNYYSIFIIQ